LLASLSPFITNGSADNDGLDNDIWVYQTMFLG